jgi:hypothetical protein
VPPIQFWLELLACVLLALGASGLFSRSTGKRVAVVIDNSKSMSALQTSGQTRLETAKRVAAADISQSGAYAHFAIFGAAPGIENPPQENPDLKAARLSSSSSALTQLDSISQSYGADRLSSQVSALVASNRFDDIWIYTDKTTSGEAQSSNVRVTTLPSDPSTLGNLWINSLTSVQSGSGAALQSTITANISSVGHSSITLELAAQCADLLSNTTFSLSSKSVSVKGASSASTELGPIIRPWSYCQVKIVSPTGGIGDAITLDNDGWVTYSSTKDEIALVSSLSPREVGLTGLPYQIAPRDPANLIESGSRAIYHRVAPLEAVSALKPGIAPPAGTSLFIFPPSGTELWGNGRVTHAELNDAHITRWDTSHPLLRYVNPALITIPKAATLVCPNSSKPILYTTTGPVACAGEESGSRYVITGFELLPFDGLRSATVSILTLNTLQWLFGDYSASQPNDSTNALLVSSNITALSLSIGSIALPRSVASAKIVAPSAKPIQQLTDHRTLITEPGVLALTNQQPNSLADRIYPINAFSSEESDISQQHAFVSAPPPDQHPGSPVGENSTSAASREEVPLEPWFTTALLAVLLLDLARRLIARARWGAAA